jgi:site-specific recombinase XerD
MGDPRWAVHLTRREVPEPAVRAAGLAGLPGEFGGWLDEAGLVESVPFLLSPSWEYDVALNGFFQGARMVGAASNTRMGYARDLAGFLNFLWFSRGGRSWREAMEVDHVAYLVWRRRDEAGPQVAGATWNREVAAVNEFYRWAISHGHVRVNPVPVRAGRAVPVWAGRGRGGAAMVPATYAHDGAGERVDWLPPAQYRQWRDVGVRGYGPGGLADPGFRGRWAARNALFADLLVRTGLRLSEQSSLCASEVPVAQGGGGYQRFWLPAAIAKGGSARWVYVPDLLAGELAAYARIDRAEVIEQARAAGRYEMPGALIVEEPGSDVVAAGRRGRRVRIEDLDPAARRRLLVRTGAGLEPGMFWLGEDGTPLTVSTWKSMFAAANARCARAGLAVRAHAHLLRHTFAVVTLEQLQRGHIAALGDLDPAQRGHYTRVFGDPLDWVRRRLGHRSVVTTSIYLHALAELEMGTRMALVPSTWEDPRRMPLAMLADEVGELEDGR